jgi:hypothetical protein
MSNAHFRLMLTLLAFKRTEEADSKCCAMRIAPAGGQLG